MSCIAEEVVAAWSAGVITDDERTTALAHAAACPGCQALLGEVFGAEVDGTPVTIGRYTVLGPLAGGGMGVIVRAHDPVLDRAVAIKLANTAEPDGHDRVLREAQALAKLEHPNVVAVHDCGVSGGEVFLAMALVHGVPLTAWMAGEHRYAERVRVLTEVAAGLAAIHDAGLVHRDIKPDNVMIRASGQALIVDFGLARAPTLGAGSGVAGTRDYLAPEVIAGQPASAASDQYAWWILVREVLHGSEMPARHRAKIDAAIARGTSSARFGDMHAAMAAIRFPVRWKLGVAIGAAALLAASAAIVLLARGDAVDRCAWSPSEWTTARPGVAAALRGAGVDVNRVLAALDARATTTATLRRKACVLAGSRSADDRALAQYRLACLDRAWADTTMQLRALGSSDRTEVWAALDTVGLVLAPERCTSAARAITAPASTDPNAEVTRLGRLLMETARAPIAISERLARLDAQGPAIEATTYAPLIARWHVLRAGALVELGRFEDSTAALDRSELAAESSGDDELRTEIAIDRLSHAYNAGARDTAALEAKAIALVAKLDNPVRRAELADTRATLTAARGDIPAAVTLMREAIAIYDELALDASARQARALQNLGAALQLANDLPGAQAAFDRGLEVARRRFGDTAADTFEMRGARATNLLYAGRAAEARVELSAVVDGLAAHAGEGSRALLMGQLVLCQTEQELLETASALARCGAALATAERAFGPTHPQLVTYLSLYGNALRLAGKPRDALSHLERAIAIGTAGTISPTELALAKAWFALAVHATDAKDPRGAATAREIATELAALPGTEKLQREIAAAFAK